MIDDGAHAKNRELRSFGRRRGRKLSPRQARLMADLLPQVAVDLASPLPQGAVKNDTWLEIGFGGGEHLVWQAEANPDIELIGCEPFEDGVVKVLDAIDRRRLANVRIHPDDARPLLRSLPEASIARAFILFPDPWPKKRHAKRRLVSTGLLAGLARVLRKDGELRIATDIGDYARTTLLAIGSTPEFQWRAAAPGDWRAPGPDWPETRYQAKALREHRRCYFFRFRRV